MNTENEFDCNLNLPYPVIKVEKPWLRYAEMLMPLYAGSGSEMTAVAQYSYQAAILSPRNSIAADMIECVSITEMRHIEMLAKMIVMLGGDPKYRVSVPPKKVMWWNGSDVSYLTALPDILNRNIAGEKAAIAAYSNAANAIKDPGVVRVLERIIADEEHHIKIFERMKNKIV